MALHKVTVATWEVLDEGDSRRRVFFGDVIELSDAEADRALAVNAVVPLAPVEPEPTVEEKALTEWLSAEAAWKAADTSTDGQPAADGATPAGAPEKPKKANPVDEWRAYAIALGHDPEKVNAMSKADLVAELD